MQDPSAADSKRTKYQHQEMKGSNYTNNHNSETRYIVIVFKFTLDSYDITNVLRIVGSKFLDSCSI